jgi:predicted PurR-regulated permease PerM
MRPVYSAEPDLTRHLLVVVLLVLLVGGSLWVMRPFIPAIVWATMIVVSTWSVMRAVEKHLRRRWVAVTVMTTAFVLVFVVPVAMAIATIAQEGLPPPPAWIERVPLVGERIAQGWRDLTAGGTDGLLAQITPHIDEVLKWFAGQAGSFGIGFVQFLLTVVLSAVMYATGEQAAAGVLRFARRVAPRRADEVVTLGAAAIRGVAFGVIGTALAQTALGALGLAIAGVPFVALLSALMFMMCIAQVGVVLVLAPAVGWLFWKDSTGLGTFLLVWTIIVATMDNFLRPILIRKGADLPLLLIFGGVIGGLLAFGLVGLFIGPVLLGITYKLLHAWIDEVPRAAAAPVLPAPPASAAPEHPTEPHE